MKISVVDLRKGPREIAFRLSADDLELEAEGFRFPEPITGQVRFQVLGKRVLGRGMLESRVQTECVRCLKPIEFPVQSRIELVFEPRPETGEDKQAALAAEWEAESREIEYYDEEMIDPSEGLRQLVLLELPGYPLCSESCRGLCPQCGGNLNDVRCRCQDTASVPVGETHWKASLRKIRLS